MRETMQLVSVNIGRAGTVGHGDRLTTSGICKRPVDGPVAVGETGMAGDSIVDLEHHGGRDQAVYGYSLEDYQWWSESTGVQFAPGTFGENMTIRGMPTNMNIGDRLLIGEVVLEAAAPRIPCSTLAARMENSGFGMAFRKAERPGVYFRVLNGGDVQAGDTVTLVENESSDVSVVDLFRFYYARRHDVDTLQRYLGAPLAERFRAKVEGKLAAAEQAARHLLRPSTL